MSETVVKVQRLLHSSHWQDPNTCLVYGKGKSNMMEMIVPAKIIAALGTELKAYFTANFLNGKWEIGRRSPDQLW